ncbi:MAG: hypothetical protein A2231_08915 [Candidatus Firestonebacteria bacterium RIFOXYA2_FULL_40_8]|nr:MAG: hypothetical protein A2231_08915 [Candidatus Firestonebacteria bacterium RIFOXYA2_FULL_40_8]
MKKILFASLVLILLPVCFFAAAPQGLDELYARTLRAAETGEKPFALLLKDGTYQPETVYFTDTETGRLIMKMTNGYNQNFHTERIPVWNCDGSRLVFHTDRLKGYNWMMNADGSGLKRIPGTNNYFCLPVWDKTDPDIMYSSWDDVVKINVKTGVQSVIRTISDKNNNPKGVGLWCTLSPNSYLIAVRNRPSLAMGSYIYTMKTDGSDFKSYSLDDLVAGTAHNAERFGGGLHSISFTNKSDDSFTFGFGLDFAVGEFFGFTCNINGTLVTNETKAALRFGHSANSPTGDRIFGYTQKGLCVLDKATNDYKVIWDKTHVDDGHTSWRNDLAPEWAIATPGPEGKDPIINHRRMVMRFKVDGSGEKEVLCNTFTRSLWSTTGPTKNQVEANSVVTNYNTYARGTVNRDGTQVHFTSDILAGYNKTDLYIVFVNPIKETTSVISSSAVKNAEKQYTVSWNAVSSPDVHHYNIYYSSVSADFPADQAHIIASMPKSMTSYFDWEAESGKPAYYKVMAVSRSK